MSTTDPKAAFLETFMRATADTADGDVVAERFVAAGWRPPLPEPAREPFDPNDESPAALVAAYLAHFLGERPARMAAHIARGLDVLGLLRPSPLPGSETQWGYRFGSGAVDCVGTEKRARSEALRAIEMTGSRVALVRREVGPWIEVTS